MCLTAPGVRIPRVPPNNIKIIDEGNMMSIKIIIEDGPSAAVSELKPGEVFYYIKSYWMMVSATNPDNLPKHAVGSNHRDLYRLVAGENGAIKSRVVLNLETGLLHYLNTDPLVDVLPAEIHIKLPEAVAEE